MCCSLLGKFQNTYKIIELKEGGRNFVYISSQLSLIIPYLQG